MQLVFKAAGGKYTFQIEGKDIKDIFTQVAGIQDIFERNQQHCSVDSILQVRDIDGNLFYERYCPKCRHVFSYGQHKGAGTLFPNNKKGWTMYDPNANSESEPSEAPAKPTKKAR